MKRIGLFLILCVSSTPPITAQGILYPRESPTRQVVTLDGLWNFAVPSASQQHRGHEEQWYRKSLRAVEDVDIDLMAVPSSYNDISTDSAVRDHVGIVWYDRDFVIPVTWYGQVRIMLRFGSVCYAAQVWVNGQLTVTHEIGHLPFEAEITNYVLWGAENRITVSVNNTLTPETIPQGTTERLPHSGRVVQNYEFDFYNYAGIDRPVVIHITPIDSHIDDISVTTDHVNDLGVVHYAVDYASSRNATVRVTLEDRDGRGVAVNVGATGTLEVATPKLWWPYLMADDPGYLYSLKVELLSGVNLLDSYSQPIGIRTVKWDSTSLYINDRPVYLKGFGRHEDSDIRGKGLDLALVLRDYNLIKWIGANAFRTSHYPYAEEIMDLADRNGIMIIDECPSVDTDIYSDVLLDRHKSSISQLIQRDKNRPSVIMWSAANEPRTANPAAEDYFRDVIGHIKSLDPTRPTTVVEYLGFDEVYSSQWADILSVNRYIGWYTDGGNLDVIEPDLVQDLYNWHRKYNKPVIMQEYGADTMEGLHFAPDFIWSEEYQVNLMSEYFRAFDELRGQGFFIGEFIWNFADFKTGQSYTRVGGNKKGIFTRSRQPKASAHHLRKRYWALAEEMYGYQPPEDLYGYVNQPQRDEL